MTGVFGSSDPIRVLLADDDVVVRTGLAALLARRPPIEVVGEAADGLSALGAALSLRPHVLVMDVRMPVMDGITATRRLLSDWTTPEPRPRVLMLSTFDSDEYVHSALRAGASGFLRKDASPDEIAQAVRVVAAGDGMLSPSVTGRLIQQTVRRLVEPEESDLAGTELLTRRDVEVVRLVASGLSNAGIAAELGLSEPSVKNRVTKVLAKLGLDNRVQLAIFAIKVGLAKLS
ncbi:response regulator transcription factor [Allokutzneria sp. A3M-2-11 16]|uniref:response regulator transcription factor n=1 Tax=Allokutzneria sp. A3M-2-11 16 TaxID=2962043 RepID=UPI0020B85BB9|nr:response regulator transcription factor [Allokutzneria sp. A3M-2-11 16]MCP3798274.1 response regulator transcription factor [Allokutzneria sp. A3M-2-11 16]